MKTIYWLGILLVVCVTCEVKAQYFTGFENPPYSSTGGNLSGADGWTGGSSQFTTSSTYPHSEVQQSLKVANTIAAQSVTRDIVSTNNLNNFTVDFMDSGFSSNYRTLWLYLTTKDGSGNSMGVTQVVLTYGASVLDNCTIMCDRYDNNNTRIAGGVNMLIPPTSWMPNGWNTFQVVFDFSAHTFKILINGTVLVSNVQWHSQAVGIKNIQLNTSTTTGGGPLYYDNLNVTADLVIDSFLSPAGWTPVYAAQAASAATVDGVSCVSLLSNFTTSSQRGAWQKLVNLDLAPYNSFSCRIKVHDPSKIQMISFLFHIVNGGWWICYNAVPLTTDQWQTIQLDKSRFVSDGICNGWNQIDFINISVWQAQPVAGIAVVSIVDLRKRILDKVNFARNGSFETCSTEALPDAWGTSDCGGLAADNWVTNTALWRAAWTIDNTTSHSGFNSLRIIGSGNELRATNYCGALAGSSINPKTYTLSAWMKSDLANKHVWMAIGGLPAQLVNVAGTDWARYSITGQYTWNQNRVVCNIQPFDPESGTLWIDDVQLEEGTTPTAYSTSIKDENLVNPQIHRTPYAVSDFAIVSGTNVLPQVTIDGNGRFLIDGKPFIPIAMGWSKPVPMGNPSLETFSEIAKAGFNTVCLNLCTQTLANLKTVLDNANINGLKVIFRVDNSVTNDTLQSWVSDSAHMLRDHPAIIAWCVYDEPTSGTLATATTRYDIVKANINLPVYFTYAFDMYWCNMPGDIASMDNYSTYLSVLGINAYTLNYFATPAGKPSWMWLAAFGDREPTAPEEECMTYATLINGVRGINYFINKPKSEELWNELRALTREVRALTQVLYSMDAAPTVSVNSSSIHLLSKRYGLQNYVIAVNVSPEPVNATLTIPGVNQMSRVLFENRVVQGSGGTFTDTFAGYQRHVYVIDNDSRRHLTFDENPGVASDCSGNGNNGILSNMDFPAVWVSGRIGNALNFNNADNNDYVDCGNLSSLQLTGDLTLSFWINPNNVTARRQNPLDKSYSGEFALTIETNGQLSYFHHSSVSPYYWQNYTCPAGTIQNGIWQHIAVTRNASTREVKIYYNGIPKSTATYPTNALPTASANPVKIGNGYVGAFGGQIDDVRIYSRALSQDEITELANP